jgi:tetratricopeptide (TPR) repeat protein
MDPNIDQLIKNGNNYKNKDALSKLINYYKANKNYEEMKKYCLMAIDLGDVEAIKNLAEYYKGEDDDEEMKKYYLMAIKELHKMEFTIYTY